LSDFRSIGLLPCVSIVVILRGLFSFRKSPEYRGLCIPFCTGLFQPRAPLTSLLSAMFFSCVAFHKKHDATPVTSHDRLYFPPTRPLQQIIRLFAFVLLTLLRFYKTARQRPFPARSNAVTIPFLNIAFPSFQRNIFLYETVCPLCILPPAVQQHPGFISNRFCGTSSRPAFSLRATILFFSMN